VTLMRSLYYQQIPTSRSRRSRRLAIRACRSGARSPACFPNHFFLYASRLLLRFIEDLKADAEPNPIAGVVSCRLQTGAPSEHKHMGRRARSMPIVTDVGCFLSSGHEKTRKALVFSCVAKNAVVSQACATLRLKLSNVRKRSPLNGPLMMLSNGMRTTALPAPAEFGGKYW
jgi:hypothetical protein